jgi:hypothetical protein
MPIDPNVTRIGHVCELLTDAEAAIIEAQRAALALSVGRRMGPAAREALSRRLAGVIGALESTRIWLASGAPR